MHLQAFAVISVSDHFPWLHRNFWFWEPDVYIRPLCSLLVPTELAVLSIWHTNGLIQSEENPTTNLSQVSHQSKLFFLGMKANGMCGACLSPKAARSSPGRAETLRGRSLRVLVGRGYSRWKGMAVSFCCASSACFRFSSVDANKGLLIKCFI